MLRIGLTGGIGSGKSTVASIFEILGVPVYYADESAKRLMNEDEDLIKSIKAVFGENSYHNGKLNREYISSIVFSNKTKLDELNAIVHPATINDAAKWMNKQNTNYAIKEAALIFESHSQQHLDYVIGVSAPLDLRLSRVAARDNITIEDIKKRMEKQMNEEDKISLCDFVIFNDEKNMLIPQVISLHQKLTELSIC